MAVRLSVCVPFGDAGDRVVITAAQISGGVEPQIFLYPPNGGEREASSEGASSSKMLDHPLEQSGLYTIIVNDGAMDEDGEFSLTFTKDPSDERLGIYDPFPMNGRSAAITCDNFAWRAVAGATGYDFYFGDDVTEPLILLGENLPTASILFPEMMPFTVYYWHVVAHTPGRDIQGPVWWIETDGYFGDFDNDGDVDGKDLFVFSAAMQVYDAVADFNHDNEV